MYILTISCSIYQKVFVRSIVIHSMHIWPNFTFGIETFKYSSKTVRKEQFISLG